MQNLRHTLCVSLVFVLSATGVLTHAEEPKPDTTRSWQQLKPERLVSDSTFIYIATPDFKKARAAFERTAFRSLLREEEVAIPLMTTYATLRDAYVRGDGTRSESETRRRGDEVDLLMKLAPLFDGQIAIAIDAGADTAGMAKGNLPRFLLLASLPSGEEGEKRYREIESTMERHRSSQCTDPRFKDSDERVGNYDVVRIENTELSLNESWAFCENLFIYGQGKRVVEDAIDRYLKNSAGTLALHAGYQAAYDQVGRGESGDALFYVQADMRPIWKQMSDSSEVLKAAFNPKMATLEANRPHFALGMHIGAGDKASIREKMFFRMTKDELPKNTAPCTATSARFAQGDTLFYTVEQNNLADVYKSYLDKLKLGAVAPATPANPANPAVPANPEKKDASFERLKASLGATTDAEVASKLELFKGELAMFVAFVPQPNLKMDSPLDYLEVFQPVFVVELDRDNAMAEQNARNLLVNNVARATGQEYIQTMTSNVPMWHQKGAGPREEKAGSVANGFFANLISAETANAPFFSAFTFLTLDVDGGRQRRFLLMSDSLNAIKKAIRQSLPENAKSSLADDSKLKDITKGFRESRSTLSYLELKKLVDVYSSEMPRLSKSSSFSPEMVEQLPSAGVLREYMFPMAWAASVINEPEGMLMESNSPMGNLPMVGLVGSVAWPAIVAQRQKGISDEVDVKFKKIMVGLHLYAADFDRFPLQLSDIYKYVNKDLNIFESPFRRGSVKQIQDIDVPDLTNLVYVPARSLQDLGDDILVYEKEPTKLLRTRDGMKLFHHIITLDGKKTFLPTASLERRLAGKSELMTTNIGEGPTSTTGTKGGGGSSAPRRQPRK